MADEETYGLLDWAEKEETEIDDDIDLTNASKKKSAALFNIMGTIVKGEPLQILYNSNYNGAET